MAKVVGKRGNRDNGGEESLAASGHGWRCDILRWGEICIVVLQSGHTFIHLIKLVSTWSWEDWCALHTLAMQLYSKGSDATFMASVAPIATRVDIVAMMDMANGPSSLQNRSIRRMRAFMTITWVSVRFHVYRLAPAP